MTQKTRLAGYLRNFKKINPLDAWQMLGIYRLSAIVYDLRKENWNIKTTDLTVYNKFGDKCIVAQYELVDDALQV